MTFWEGRRVLVTGCSGLIGAPLCKRLLEEKAQLVGYDLEVAGCLASYGIQGAFPVVQGSILNGVRLARALEGNEVCIHLAAMSNVTACRRNALATWQVNVQGTWATLEACRHTTAIKSVVIASSNHIYGQQDRPGPVAENAPLRQLDTYSAAKICADYLGQAYAHNYGVPVAIVRNTNCFGPHDPHNDHIVPGTILSVLRGEPPVIRSRGLTRKSYLYVEDVVNAYLDIAEWQYGKDGGTAFNVADTPISVRDLVNLLLKVMETRLSPIILGEPNDQADEYLDCTRIRTLLGWQPQYTLEKGLRETVEGFVSRTGQEVASHGSVP